MSDGSTISKTGPQASQLANGVVHLLADTIGRGPTKSRAHICEDLIAVVVEGYMTKSEQVLVDDGNADIVLAGRRAIQEGMREQLTDLVESVTGREVQAFFSDNRTRPDMAVEVFLLKPLETSNNNRAPRGASGLA